MEKEMLVLAASVAKPIDLLNKMEEAISEYKEAELLNDENKQERVYLSILTMCHMLILNKEANGTIEGGLKIIQKINHMKQQEELYTSKKN